MHSIPITKLYETQISLTEWFQQIDHPQTEAHRKEDNEKRERILKDGDRVEVDATNGTVRILL